MNPLISTPSSFSYFYDTNDKGFIPFYHGTDVQSIMNYLSVPIKRNTQLNQSPNSPTKKRTSLFAKAFLSDKPIDTNQSQYIDFKKALLDTLLRVDGVQYEKLATAAEKSSLQSLTENGINNMTINDVFQKHANKAKVFLPNDSQWNLINQLRIHSGAPERSDDGLERLLQ